MPAGMSFMQLEGNYVISFRDTSECLPAFTAVRLDRRRGSADSGVVFGGGGGGGGGPLLGAPGFGGSARDLLYAPGDSSPTARRPRASSLTTGHKLVITGIPRQVSTEIIRERLEDVIPGIVRVYRDADMTRILTHPPIILETRLALAEDAFMLRPDWVPVVQRLIQQASKPAAGATEEQDVRFDSLGGGGTEDADDKPDRRKSLAALDVVCPHGRYRGDNTCPICRHQRRRDTALADGLLSHAQAEDLRRPKPKPSCLSCLFRLMPRRVTPRPNTPPPEPVPESSPRPRPLSSSGPGGFLKVASDSTNQRRYSTYEDVRAGAPQNILLTTPSQRQLRI